ncbi:MAG: hypothetical protein BroJett030_11810 [Alphaproteobacteria bacterium]|nr:MAG: hypothetical protein BroJett030_11810 [Alphaproteobacteria bacterium]
MDLLPADVAGGAAAALIVASFFTSALTAAFGIGGGVALLTVMGYLLPVASLIPVHGVVQLGSNTGRALIQRAHIDWSAALPFLAGSLVGVALGTPFVVRLDDPLLKVGLGAFIIAVTWVRLPALARGGPALFAGGGLVTAFLTMFFGATGPLTAAFLGRSLPDRRQYSGTHAAIMTAQHGFKVIAFGLTGFAFVTWLPLLVAMVAAGFAGTAAGARLLARLPEARFRLAFSLLLTVLALDLIRRGLAAMF